MQKIAIVLYAAFICGRLYAGEISLETQCAGSAEGDRVRLSIELINRGNESAYNVVSEIRCDGVPEFLPGKSELLPLGSFRAEGYIKSPARGPGAYSLALITSYADKNGYPFSAVSRISYVRGEARPPEIIADLKGASLSKNGKLVLNIKSVSEEKLILAAKLVLPKELVCGTGEREALLNPRGQAILKFPIRNIGALPGSAYPIFAIIDYESGGL